MEMDARPIPPFCCEQIERTRLAREWKSWKTSLEFYFEAHGILEQKMKRAKMLYLGGPQLQRVFTNLPDADKVPLVAWEKKWFDVAVEKLDEYFQPVRQDTLERHRLREMKQRKDERFSQFLLRLRQQCADCGFDKHPPEVAKVLMEVTLVDVIVEGCSSNELRRRILKEDRTLEQIEALGAMYEGVEEQVKWLNSDQRTEEKVFQVAEKPQVVSRSVPSDRTACFNCGITGHWSKSPQCPARNQICRKCKRKGHFKAFCRSNQPIASMNERPSKKIRVIQSEAESKDEPRLDEREKNYYAFYSGNKTNIIGCRIGGVKWQILIDSGADCNLISSEAWRQLKDAKIDVYSSAKGSNRTLRAYGSEQPLNVLGSFVADIQIGPKCTKAEFFVVERGQQCLLGDTTSKELGVLKVGLDIQNVEEDCKPFTKIAGIQIQIHMDPKAKPVFQPLRKVPIPLEAAVNRKLDQLLARDIIEVKTGPTSWVSPLVVVGKSDGEPRLCLDLRRVNEAVLRERYPMPIVDEYLARLGKNMLRSKLDIREAFLQVELAPESRDATTFITSKGLFRFKRLPFGLVTAPEAFQRTMDEILTGCEGTHWYLDDIIVEGATVDEHDQRLKKVLKRLEERGVELNWQKCAFKANTLEFLGHLITTEGIFPMKNKSDAIISFREPSNETEVRSFLGLANYMNKFIPNLATIDEPLRYLTQKGVRFQWTDTHSKAFEKIKHSMSQAGRLGYFDVNDRTIVLADASPVGLGAILAQVDRNQQTRIISYASKSLTNTETRYCQTEKEALSLVWAVERFQVYLIGRPFDLVTDCKALQYLFTPRSRPCARIERWILRIQAFEYNIIHIAGEKNAADALSRLSTVESRPFDDTEELVIREVASCAAGAVALTWSEIQNACWDDEEMQEVIKILKDDRALDLPVSYRVVATELCVIDDVLMRVDRVVIPNKLRSMVLELAHEGHPGNNMMKTFMRTNVWWPKMDRDVDDFVKCCRGCNLVAAPGPPEPLVRREMPCGPWEDLAVDFLGPLPEGQHLLVVVDYYSRYIEVREMLSTSTRDTVQELSSIFALFGLPITLKADNGPQFSSDCEEFSSFCNENGIRLINTVPYWPQQNGEVERQNRSILKRLRIAQQLGKDWRIELSKFLLMYHSTNHPTTGKSPSELMFGRRIRNKLPHIPQFKLDDEEVRDRDRVQKEKGKQYTDTKRKARLSEIKVGDHVLLKRMKKVNKLDSEYLNEEFIVTRKEGMDCTVKSSDSGKEYRRSVAHLKRLMRNDDSSEGVLDGSEDFGLRSRPEDVSQTQGTAELTTKADVRDPPVDEPLRKRICREPSRFQDYIPH